MIPWEQLTGRRPFNCPQCGGELAADDVNVAQDAALCRACGYQGAFLNALLVPGLSDHDLTHPPKRVQLTRGFGDTLVITCFPARGTLAFLIPFTLFWSGISIWGLIVRPLLAPEAMEWRQILFALPFLLGTLLLLANIAFLIAGRTVLTVSKNQLELYMGAFNIGRRKILARSPEMTVTLAKSNYQVNKVRQPEIVVTSQGRTLRFGAMGIPNDVLPYVAAVLRRTLAGG
ncbi:MAG TPA: hypothetical protein PLD40_00180 [Kiritimatiellia bacterium]|nr:hypothetical protein [Kiritimatiellia bacterium]HOE36743.1 hypothetical protein [Kiritimatiellia bacterium]HOR74238.1 hypothetical protein [Kiritimatiellia bacterium]HOU58355.1 hypothetical protein [Kiritimatiellia bacterium]HPK68608.1 hypothetical protein [Kiritimatiellia bacterium]